MRSFWISLNECNFSTVGSNVLGDERYGGSALTSQSRRYIICLRLFVSCIVTMLQHLPRRWLLFNGRAICAKRRKCFDWCLQNFSPESRIGVLRSEGRRLHRIYWQLPRSIELPVVSKCGVLSSNSSCTSESGFGGGRTGVSVKFVLQCRESETDLVALIQV